MTTSPTHQQELIFINPNIKEKSHLKIKLIQLHKRNPLPRARPPPPTKDNINRPHHLLLLLSTALDEPFRPEDIGVLAKDAFIPRQSNRVMSDAGATRHELAVEGFPLGRHDLVMPKGDGDADAEAFPEDGL